MKIKRPAFIFIFFIFLISTGAAQTSNSTSNNTAMIQIDQSTTLLDVKWNDPTTTFIFESDIPRIVTIVDSNSIPKSGAGQVNFKQVNLAAGKTKVTMQLERDGASKSVTMSVGDSMIAVSNPPKPLIEKITRADFYLGMLLVAILTPINLLIAIWWDKIGLSRDLIRVG